MSDSWGNGLKTPVNGLLHKNFKFGPLFGYHNFENQIDTWETTVGHGFGTWPTIWLQKSMPSRIE